MRMKGQVIIKYNEEKKSSPLHDYLNIRYGDFKLFNIFWQYIYLKIF
jgi:hypothetical protein